MNLRKLTSVIVAIVILVALVAASGCDNHSGNEWQRLVCEVHSINAGAPLVSAYVNVGQDGIEGTQDDSLPIDWVPVTFRARTYNDMIVTPEDAPYSWFHITNYDLNWHPGPGAPSDMTTYNVKGGMCDVLVPAHDVATVGILIADRGMKDESWYRGILYDDWGSYTATCELLFYGHATGSDQTTVVGGGFTVTFYGRITDD